MGRNVSGAGAKIFELAPSHVMNWTPSPAVAFELKKALMEVNRIPSFTHFHRKLRKLCAGVRVKSGGWLCHIPPDFLNPENGDSDAHQSRNKFIYAHWFENKVPSQISSSKIQFQIFMVFAFWDFQSHISTRVFGRIFCVHWFALISVGAFLHSQAKWFVSLDPKPCGSCQRTATPWPYSTAFEATPSLNGINSLILAVRYLGGFFCMLIVPFQFGCGYEVFGMVIFLHPPPRLSELISFADSIRKMQFKP